MPTGYTAAIQDGSQTELAEFVMSCARNFGALVTMRDAPADAPIPEEFEPSTYARDHLTASIDALADAQGWSDEDAKAMEIAERERAAARRAAALEKSAEEERRYRAMLARVEAWEPPTPEHQGLKEFMVSQLVESIRYDCGPIGSWYDPPAERSAAEYREQEIARRSEELERAQQRWDEEVERVNSRNTWVRALRESLA